MRIVLENVEGIYYGDIILSDADLKRIGDGHLVYSDAFVDGSAYYLGLRKRSIWEEELFWEDENETKYEKNRESEESDA